MTQDIYRRPRPAGLKTRFRRFSEKLHTGAPSKGLFRRLRATAGKRLPHFTRIERQAD